MLNLCEQNHILLKPALTLKPNSQTLKLCQPIVLSVMVVLTAPRE
jgi:hypothetical protein